MQTTTCSPMQHNLQKKHYYFTMNAKTMDQIINGNLADFKCLHSTKKIEIYLDTHDLDLIFSNHWLKIVFDVDTSVLSYCLNLACKANEKFVEYEQITNLQQIMDKLCQVIPGSLHNTPISQLCPRVLTVLTIYRTAIYQDYNCDMYLESVQLKPNDSHWYVLGTLNVKNCDKPLPAIDQLGLLVPTLSKVTQSIACNLPWLFDSLQPEIIAQAECKFDKENYLEYNILASQMASISQSDMSQALELVGVKLPDYSTPILSEWQQEHDKIASMYFA